MLRRASRHLHIIGHAFKKYVSGATLSDYEYENGDLKALPDYKPLPHHLPDRPIGEARKYERVCNNEPEQETPNTPVSLPEPRKLSQNELLAEKVFSQFARDHFKRKRHQVESRLDDLVGLPRHELEARMRDWRLFQRTTQEGLEEFSSSTLVDDQTPDYFAQQSFTDLLDDSKQQEGSVTGAKSYARSVQHTLGNWVEMHE